MQRALCKDPVLIRSWFKLVEQTKAKYSICDNDVYNFNEAGFMLGKITTQLVVTALERRGRPKSIQPGNRAGLVPFQPDVVLSKLNVQLRTPTLPAALTEAPWEARTPSNLARIYSLNMRLISRLLMTSVREASNQASAVRLLRAAQGAGSKATTHHYAVELHDFRAAQTW
ncbi:hypothetical protein OPT61_g6360 [Boeremia exigua]|uniref:Uncharacterized protein n=1 Tax=Boeremia exigua TaxID=749465 RepID=A0ACC2I6X2_9PLEO|nr:hypothetical protein OPT61_g6360 [Boeremia exigua]